MDNDMRTVRRVGLCLGLASLVYGGFPNIICLTRLLLQLLLAKPRIVPGVMGVCVGSFIIMSLLWRAADWCEKRGIDIVSGKLFPFVSAVMAAFVASLFGLILLSVVVVVLDNVPSFEALTELNTWRILGHTVVRSLTFFLFCAVFPLIGAGLFGNFFRFADMERIGSTEFFDSKPDVNLLHIGLFWGMAIAGFVYMVVGWPK